MIPGLSEVSLVIVPENVNLRKLLGNLWSFHVGSIMPSPSGEPKESSALRRLDAFLSSQLGKLKLVCFYNTCSWIG